jgi:protocatechuate 3,4-dioxygenase beta subunit
MKPLHLALAAAALLVAALLLLLARDDGGRGGARPTPSHESEAGGRGDAADDTDAGGIDASGGAGESAAPGAPPGDTGPNSILLKIVGPDDAPASHCDVTLDRGVDALRATADEIGVLRVQDLAPGAYDLRARHGDLGGTLRFETKGALDLGTLRLVATVTISGRVFGPRGEPLASALIEALRATEPADIHVRGRLVRALPPDELAAAAATRADGAYALVVPVGEAYALRATARGLASASRAPAVFLADAPGIDLHLKEGAVLEGRVVDATEATVAQARVLAGLDERTAVAETVTAADGSFSLMVEPGARHTLTAIAPGFARQQLPVAAPRTDLVIVLREGVALRLEAVEKGRPRTPAARVHAAVTYIGGSAAGETDAQGRLLLENLWLAPAVAGGQRLHLWGRGYVPLEIDLARAQATDGVVDLGVVELTRGGVATGRVFDRTTGRPIGGARVGAFGGPMGNFDPSSLATAVSAQDGSFRLEGVPLDAHTLTAIHDHFVDEALPALVAGGARGQRLLGERHEVMKDVEMVPAEFLRGVVLAPDGAPAAEAEVRVMEDRGRIARLLGSEALTAKSDAKGAFGIEAFHRGQRLMLWASHADYGRSETVHAVAGTGESATLRLTEPVIVSGTVADPGGAPIAGVRVEAGEVATTDADGRYAVRAHIGRVWLIFEHPDYLPAMLEARVGGSMEFGRTVLMHGETIAGVVVRKDGTATPGVLVHATMTGPPPRGSRRQGGRAVTDAKGAFGIKGLEEGEYRLRTREPDAWAAEVTARTGARDVRIVLHPTGTLTGRVTARGAAVAGASVRAELSGFLGSARTADDGTFEIHALPSGSAFDVVVEHDDFRTLRVEGVETSDRPRTFALEPGAEVSGHVVDGRGGPVAGAEVDIRVDGRDVRRVRADARGAFQARGLPEGRIAVRLVPSDGGLVATGWLDVDAGARGVRLVAAEGASISGVVRHAAGRPAKEIVVEAIDAAGVRAAATWVWDADGAFVLRGLRAGAYTVRAAAGGRTGEAREIAAGTTGLEIALGP